MRKDRISWVDIARGIGIILVVYGHTLSADSFRYLIYAFHMPLFFFLSGLVFKYKKEENLLNFISKNAKNILLPYLIFSLLSFLLWITTREITFNEQIKQLLSIFYGNGNNGLLRFNNILWFLPCLFITRLFFYMLTRYSIRNVFLLGSLFGISIFGYLFSLFFNGWKLFFGIETMLTAVVFFGLGYLWTTLSEKTFMKFKQYGVIHLVIFSLLCILFGYLNYATYDLQIDMRLNRLNNYFYFYFSALSGIIAIVFMSIMIHKNKILEYLGKKTLIIFAWHLLAFPYVTQLLIITQLAPFVRELPPFFSPVIYTILSISILLIIDAGYLIAVRYFKKTI